MMPNAANLSPDDMADIGAYFDSQVNTGLEADPSYWKAGEKLYRAGDKARGIPACMACHGPTGQRQRAREISGVARPTLGVRRQAVDRLRLGRPDHRTERHHADHRQAPFGRRHAQCRVLLQGIR